MPIAKGIFVFNPPPPRHFEWIVFAFLALYRPTDYIYKIWLSLLQGQGFTFFSPHPTFGWCLGGIFQTKVVRNNIPYNFAHNKICRSVNNLGVI